jgi:ABC-2 type transport system ATP-binding protein
MVPSESRTKPRGVGVEARGLTRAFGQRVALQDVSLSISPGSAFGLLGANGAGKTTFIRLVAGTLLPSRGEVTVAGISPGDHPKAVQAFTGFVPERSRLYPELGVGRYLRFCAGVRGLSGTSRDDAVSRVCERFALESVLKRPIGNLSKGLQQRISLAQAFLHEPRLLIVDEPTNGLDPLQQAEVREALLSLQGECTVLICTHDLAEARALTQQLTILAHGKQATIGATEEVLNGEDPLALFRSLPPAAA